MRIIFMLEELSMKVLLDGILPRILPEGIGFLTIPHDGKRDLELSLPKKLGAWNEPDVAFVVVHDQDSNDCVELKRNLQGICAASRRQTLVRIACRELEAWYWGDLAAVSEAYGVDLKYLSGKRKYREPDSIDHPKKELKRYIPQMGQIEGARKIAPYMNLEENTSHSFQVFVQGIKRLCGVDACGG